MAIEKSFRVKKGLIVGDVEVFDSSGSLQASSLGSISSTDVTEGTNLYYTTTRADSDIADYLTGSISTGNITTTGYIRGPSTFTIDPAVHGDSSGTLVILGNLQVDGTTTTINSTTVEVDDKNIVLASGAINAAAADGAGITIDGASATLTYSSSADAFVFNKDVDINGGTIDGVTIGGASAGAITGTTITGTSFVSSGDMTFGDDDKAIFGAGSDLQIYHTGSNSIIDDLGTGNLLIRSDGTAISLQVNSKNSVRAVADEDVELYYNGSEKLATTATGIDVTGNITVGTNDSIFAENNLRFKSTGAAFIDHNTVGQNINFRLSNASSLDVTPLVLSPTTVTVAGNLSVDGGTIKLDGNYPVGTNNVALGNLALSGSLSGSNNVAIGHATLDFNTSGSSNTGVGYASLTDNSTGSDNTGVGEFSLANNTSGAYNTALGSNALFSNTAASNNTAVGYQAGYSAQTNGYNTFIGQTAGYSTTGVGNTFVGCTNASVGAGYFVTTGTKNTIIGGFHGNQGGLDIRTSSNNIVLSDGDGNPRFIVDNSGNASLGVLPNSSQFTAANTKKLYSASKTVSTGATTDVFSITLPGANSFAILDYEIVCSLGSPHGSGNVTSGKIAISRGLYATDADAAVTQFGYTDTGAGRMTSVQVSGTTAPSGNVVTFSITVSAFSPNHNQTASVKLYSSKTDLTVAAV